MWGLAPIERGSTHRHCLCGEEASFLLIRDESKQGLCDECAENYIYTILKHWAPEGSALNAIVQARITTRL